MDQPAFPVIKGTLTKKGNCIILVKEAKLIIEYINEALRLAKYEIIDDEEPYYGEIPVIQGVWASGRTLEECRERLKDTLDEWIILSFNRGLPIPEIN
jgi:predicted RNase H-like HicB family nuclease